MNLLLTLFLALASWGQQATAVGGAAAAIQSISVSANPTTIIPGGTSSLSATTVDANGVANVNVTYQCLWSSSNPAILAVSGNVATGVAPGNATANCALGSLVGSTPVSINVSTIVFTNPIQATCATPCILPQATNGTAYSFTFAASSSAGGPYTWAVTVGSIPAWASLNAATGALTGTPNANATTNFTVRVTDGSSNTASLAVSLTVVASVACGPPAFACSTTSTSNPGVISAPFTSTQPSGFVNTANASTGLCTIIGTQSCATYVSGTPFSASWPAQAVKINGVSYTVLAWNSDNTAKLATNAGTQTNVAYVNYAACLNNCQNTTFYDTTLNPSGTDCITRITDGTVANLGKSVGNMTASGGDNDVYGSVNETYIGVTTNGGATAILHLNLAGNCVQVVNTGHAMSVTTLGGFSKVVDTRFYYLVSNTQLWQGDITSDTTFTSTKLVDLTAANVCPGVNWATFGTPSSASILGNSTNDDTFAWTVGPGGQGSADWVFSWSRTKGCASANLATGTAWAYCASSCTSSTASLGTFNPAVACYGSKGSSGLGIHDSQMSGDGQFLFISFPGSGGGWTGGACAGKTIANQYSVWQIGTLGDQYAYSAASIGVGGAQLGSHETVGVTHVAAPYFSDGYNNRLNSALTAFTNFIAPLPVISDEHYSWAHPTNDDSYPWVGASDAQFANAGQSSGCTFEPTCPSYLVNTVMSINPNGPFAQVPILFAHTYSCNPVGALYAKCASGIGDPFGSGDAIGFATAKAHAFCWASSLLQSLGVDNTGALRVDAFCVKLQ